MSKRNLDLGMSIHNHFDIEVVDINTGEVKQRAQAFNVICNSMFNKMLNVSGSYGSTNSIAVGKGSGTPSASDTALFSYLGTASSDATYSPYDSFDQSRQHEGIWIRRLKRTITNQQFVGENITEIGIGDTRIYTHAMLQDMNGNPISINHTNTDVINVICTLYLHYAGQNGNIHLYHRTGASYGTTYYGLVYSLLFSFYLNYMSYVALSNGTSQCNGGLKQDGTTQSPVYDVANKKVTQKFSQIPIGTGNECKGFSYLCFRGGNVGDHEIMVENTTPYAITDESVGVGDGSTTKFRTKFSYPTNAKVYINGVEQTSGVTVKKWLPYPNRGNNAEAFVSGYNGDGSSSAVIPGVNVNGRGTFFAKLVDPRNTSMPAEPSYPYATLTDAYILEDLMPELGIQQIGNTSSYGQYTVEASDDMVNWTTIPKGPQSTPFHYRYYRTNYHNDWGGMEIYRPAYDGYNVIFDAPPAQGDVITVDYSTLYVPKDSDHVLDVELTFTLGEWTGE